VYVKGIDNPADGFSRAPYHQDKGEPVHEEHKPPFLVLNHMAKVAGRPRTHVEELANRLAPDIKVYASQKKLDDWSKGSLHKMIVKGYDQDPCYEDTEWLESNDIRHDEASGLWMRGDRLAIPAVPSVVEAVVREHHDTPYGGHLGVNKTVERLKRAFWWKHMTRDIEDYVKSCEACQRTRHSTAKPSGQSYPIAPATRPWQKVHIDFAGPFKKRAPGGGHNMVMIVVDSFTKMVRFIKCARDVDGKQAAELYLQHVWCLFGQPEVIVSDRGTQFTGAFWRMLHARMGTKVGLTASHHPQANGQAEVMVKQMKKMLMAFNQRGKRWWAVLPACEFAYNDSINATTGFTPFYLNYGRHPRLPLQTYLTPEEDRTLQEWVVQLQRGVAKDRGAADLNHYEAKERQRDYTNEKRREAPTFMPGDSVYVWKGQEHGLDASRSEACTVLEVKNDGRTLIVSGWANPVNVERVELVRIRASELGAHLERVFQDLKAYSQRQKEAQQEDLSRDPAVEEAIRFAVCDSLFGPESAREVMQNLADRVRDGEEDDGPEDALESGPLSPSSTVQPMASGAAETAAVRTEVPTPRAEGMLARQEEPPPAVMPTNGPIGLRPARTVHDLDIAFNGPDLSATSQQPLPEPKPGRCTPKWALKCVESETMPKGPPLRLHKQSSVCSMNKPPLYKPRLSVPSSGKNEMSSLLMGDSGATPQGGIIEARFSKFKSSATRVPWQPAWSANTRDRFSEK
jgi:hypothetical protein